MIMIWKKELEKLLGENKVKEHELLSPHTTVQIGGEALLFVEIENTDELVTTLQLAQKIELPFFLLGSGYGTLIPDSGFDGLVIKNLCRQYEALNVSGKIVQGRILVDKAYVYAESGALFTQVVRFSLDKDYSGLEGFLGFPGTVGEVIRTSSQSEVTGKNILEIVKSITILNAKGKIEEVEPQKYSSSEYDGSSILAVVFILTPGDHATNWEKADKASLYHAKMQEEGVIIGRAFHDISLADAMRIPTPSYTKKVSYLLDTAYLKGKTIGGAKVSIQNSNYLINMGNATYTDMRKLLDFMQKAVYDTFRVRLTHQIQILGDDVK